MQNHSAGELQLPRISRALDTSIWAPFIIYFGLFQLFGFFVKRWLWNECNEFRKYRLQNLSVCLIHSLVSGSWSALCLVLYVKTNSTNLIHWYEPWSGYLLLLSIGYFVHDGIDMLAHERSRWTYELILHHVVSIFLMLSALLPKKFILYVYWSLTMELNSFFLHSRTIMQLSESVDKYPRFYSSIKWLNISTFVTFRFGVQIWLMNFIWTNWNAIHAYYAYTAMLGGAFFLVINVCLFTRILAADGFLGDYCSKNWIISRDTHESIGSDSKKND